MTEQMAQRWLEQFEFPTDENSDDALATICEALQEYPKFKAIGTVKEIKIREAQFARLSEGYLNDLTLLREYQALGTVEELQALKEIDNDCTIRHLTGECSYNETGCSGCIGREKIKVALEKSGEETD